MQFSGSGQSALSSMCRFDLDDKVEAEPKIAVNKLMAISEKDNEGVETCCVRVSVPTLETDTKY